MSDATPQIPSANPAETAAILGLNPAAATGAAGGDPRWREMRERLERLRDRLLDEHAGLQGQAREDAPDSLQDEPAEIGTESFLRDQALAMNSNQRETLLEIEDALGRIDAGTFGTCEITGQPIPAERLDAIPWTRCTVEGQRQLEAEGGGLRAGLGALGTAAAGRSRLETELAASPPPRPLGDAARLRQIRGEEIAAPGAAAAPRPGPVPRLGELAPRTPAAIRGDRLASAVLITAAILVFEQIGRAKRATVRLARRLAH